METITQNIWLILLALGGAWFLVRLARGRQAAVAVSEVEPHEAAEMIRKQDAVVIDVREPDEYLGGAIPGSKHIPLRQVAGRVDELKAYAGRPIVVNCKSGRRSAHACQVLSRAGIEDVHNLKGGIHAWAAGGQKVVN